MATTEEVVLTGVTEVDLGGGSFRYDVTFATASGTATGAKVLNRDEVLGITSKTFDGTKFNYTYGNYVKTGRAMATKLESSASGTTVNQPITTALNKD